MNRRTSDNQLVARVKVRHVLEFHSGAGGYTLRYMESEQRLPRPVKSLAFAERTTSCDYCGSTLVVRVWGWNRLLRLRLLCSVLAALQVTATIALFVVFLQRWDGPNGAIPFFLVLLMVISIAALVAWPAIAFHYQGVKLLNPGKLDPIRREGPTAPVSHAVE